MTMTAKRPVLGRGLNALLKDSEKVKNEVKVVTEVSNINEILIENILGSGFHECNRWIA